MRDVGLNLAEPHKSLAVSVVDELERCARPWGAMNTIRFAGGEGSGGQRTGDAFASRGQDVGIVVGVSGDGGDDA